MNNKKKINYSEIAGISFLITIAIEVIFYIITYSFGLLIPVCQSGYYGCPSQFENFVYFLPYTAIPLFLVTFIIYYLVKIWKK